MRPIRTDLRGPRRPGVDDLPHHRETVDRALVDLCYERGFAELSVEALCGRAGMSVAEFRRRYTDVDDAFCAVFEHEMELLLSAFDAALTGARGWRARLRAVAYAFHRWLAADPARTHLMVVEIRSAPERARLIQTRGIERMIALLDEGRSAAPDPDHITHATAEALAGGILTQIYAAVEHGSLGADVDMVHQILYAAVLPYLGPEAAAEELEIGPPTIVANVGEGS